MKIESKVPVGFNNVVLTLESQLEVDFLAQLVSATGQPSEASFARALGYSPAETTRFSNELFKSLKNYQSRCSYGNQIFEIKV